MELIKLFDLFNKLYPLATQEEWDNSGFFNKYENFNVTDVLVSLDINIDVVNKAINNNIKLIISHHPIYINESDLKLNHIKKLIKIIENNNITILSLHTNFDKAKKGMNYSLLKELKLKEIKQLKESPYVFFGELKNKLDFKSILKYIKNHLDLNHIIYDEYSYHLINSKNIKRIAVVGGSGSSDLYLIKNKYKIDLFLTGEIKWHLYNLAFNKRMSLIDIGHISEKIFIKVIESVINKFCSDINVVTCENTTYLKII